MAASEITLYVGLSIVVFGAIAWIFRGATNEADVIQLPGFNFTLHEPAAAVMVLGIALVIISRTLQVSDPNPIIHDAIPGQTAKADTPIAVEPAHIPTTLPEHTKISKGDEHVETTKANEDVNFPKTTESVDIPKQSLGTHIVQLGSISTADATHDQAKNALGKLPHCGNYAPRLIPSETYKILKPDYWVFVIGPYDESDARKAKDQFVECGVKDARVRHIQE